MKIAVSGFFVENHRVGGAEQMLYNLINGWKKASCHIDLCVGANQKLDREFVEGLRDGQTNIYLRTLPSYRHRILTEQFNFKKMSKDVDGVLFPNYFTPYFKKRPNGKIVTVIHDLLFKAYPGYFAPAKRIWLEIALHQSLELADTIVVISNFTASEVERVFGGKVSRKIKVIPNPIDFFSDTKGEASPLCTSRPYLLSVGAHYPHKNYATFLEAFEELSRSFKELDWVIIGQLSENLRGHLLHVPMSELIKKKNLQGRVHLINSISRASLRNYYLNAHAVVQPSLYEGFGQPQVEALSLGAPTITAQTGSAFEITKGAAICINEPTHAKNWIDPLKEVILNRSRYEPTKAQRENLKETYAPAKISSAYSALFEGAK